MVHNIKERGLIMTLLKDFVSRVEFSLMRLLLLLLLGGLCHWIQLDRAPPPPSSLLKGLDV